LMMSSNLVGACTGKLAGASPPDHRSSFPLDEGCRTSTGPVTPTLPLTGTSSIQVYQATDFGLSFHRAP
jgi:hypothetical protein